MSLEAVILAIRLLHPERPDAETLARLIEDASRRAHVDPLALVAYVEHESRFRASAVSKDGEDHGLGQIRARYQKACRGARRSRACRAEKVRLRDPAYNLRVLAGKIRAVKKGEIWKRDRTMRAWVAALAGTTDPNHRAVREIVALYQRIRQVIRESGSAARFTCLDES